MSWQCEDCGETHADQFDACWKCEPSPTVEESHSTKRPFRFSLRTIFLTTTSISIFIGMAMYMPDEFLIKPLALLLAFGLICFVPAASLGYDNDESFEGVLTGLMWGFIVLIALTTFAAAFLPTVQS